MAGRILAGRYELIEKIGEGGMAVVFRARDRLLDRFVAIKILRPEYTKDAVFISSFRRESQVAAGLVHPNIVNVYDVGVEGNIYYIVMEYIEGRPLSEVIRDEGTIDPYRAAAITKQVASALSMAHKHQLIHRDVKPHNIMITKDGVAKITDFGIAKAVTKDTLTEAKKEAVMGSVHYFSPEQARGSYVDERSDIYSLGIVLFEMLTGHVPFDGETAVEVAVKQINEEMPSPTDIDPAIPKDLEDIIFKATAKLQTDRYKSADDMITALNFVRFSSRHPMVDAENANENSRKNFEKKSGGRFSSQKEEANEERKTLKKRHKISPTVQRAAAFALAVLLALPLSNLLYKSIYGEKQQKKEEGPAPGATVVVPKIVDMTIEEAEAILKKSGLGLETDLELPSSTWEAGKIMSQTPGEGAEVKSGYVIRVNVSKGVIDGKVPGIIGKTRKSAESMITGYGYVLGSVGSAYSDEIPKGCVLKQNPKEGVKLSANGKVNIVLSLGPENPEVGTLDVVGLTLDEAKEAILSCGLVLGSVTYTENIFVEKDYVIEQEPAASAVLEEGDAVNLIVSLGNGEESSEGGETGNGGETGPGPTEEKKAVSILVDYTPSNTETFHLTVHVHDDVNGTSVPYKQVEKNRVMGSEYITVYGNGSAGTVVILFDNVTVYTYTVDFDGGHYY